MVDNVEIQLSDFYRTNIVILILCDSFKINVEKMKHINSTHKIDKTTVNKIAD